MRSLKSLSNLTGRKVLLTGGAGHIGRAVAEGLVEWGARVAIMDRDPQACLNTVKALSKVRKNSAHAIPTDLSNEHLLRQQTQASIRQLNGLDVLIHCAAYVGTTSIPGWSVDYDKQTTNAWEAAMRVNVTSAFVMAQEAQKALSASGHGSVIFFSSIYGMVGPNFALYKGTPMANPAAYGASKGALLQLTRYLSTLFAPRIRVNAITPGGVWRSQPQAFHRRYKELTPLKRMAQEEDLKGAVAYLASDLSAYVTGQNIVVDGGWTAW